MKPVRLLLIALVVWPSAARAITPEQLAFFESRILPVLAQDCYECHNSRGKAKGGLILDHREGVAQGRFLRSGDRARRCRCQPLDSSDSARG